MAADKLIDSAQLDFALRATAKKLKSIVSGSVYESQVKNMIWDKKVGFTKYLSWLAPKTKFAQSSWTFPTQILTLENYFTYSWDLTDYMPANSTLYSVQMGNIENGEFTEISIPGVTPLINPETNVVTVDGYNNSLSTYSINCIKMKCIYPAIDLSPIDDLSTIHESWTKIKSSIEDESFFTKDYVVGDIKKITSRTSPTAYAYGEIRKIDVANKYVDFVVMNVPESCRMNTDDDMVYMVYYANSLAKQRLDTIYADELPSDLKSVITPVAKKYYAYDGTTEEVTAPLWLLNTKDAGLTGVYLKDQEGEEYFSSNAERIKYIQQTGSAYYWWLGSAYNSSSFMSVSSSGGGNYFNPNNALGLVFGFRIQKSS